MSIQPNRREDIRVKVDESKRDLDCFKDASPTDSKVESEANAASKVGKFATKVLTAVAVSAAARTVGVPPGIPLTTVSVGVSQMNPIPEHVENALETKTITDQFSDGSSKVTVTNDTGGGSSTTYVDQKGVPVIQETRLGCGAGTCETIYHPNGKVKECVYDSEGIRTVFKYDVDGNLLVGGVPLGPSSNARSGASESKNETDICPNSSKQVVGDDSSSSSQGGPHELSNNNDGIGTRSISSESDSSEEDSSVSSGPRRMQLIDFDEIINRRRSNARQNQHSSGNSSRMQVNLSGVEVGVGEKGVSIDFTPLVMSGCGKA